MLWRYLVTPRRVRCAVAVLMLSFTCETMAQTVTAVCPSEAEFREALAKLAPQRAEGFDFEAASRSARVEDLGTRYRVSIDGQAREYDDGERDCERRARTAAIYVALVLWPADEEPEPTEAAPPETAPPQPEPPPEPAPAPAAQPQPKTPNSPQTPKAPQFWLEGAGVVELGLVASAPLQVLTQIGLEQQFGSHFGAIAYAAWPVLPATIDVGPAQSELARAPLGLGVRYGWDVAGVRAAWQAAVAANWIRVQRRDGEGRDSALEPAVSTGLVLALRGSVAPQLGLHLQFVPSPHQVALTPTGVVGENPALWAGASLGLAFGLW